MDGGRMTYRQVGKACLVGNGMSRLFIKKQDYAIIEEDRECDRGRNEELRKCYEK